MLYSCKNVMPSFLESWKSIPRKTTSFPCACICFQELSRSGASSLHGSHHEAQKFKTTGLPLKFERESALFPAAGRSIASKKFGAGWPTRVSDAAFGAGVSNCVKTSASNATFNRLTTQDVS